MQTDNHLRLLDIWKIKSHLEFFQATYDFRKYNQAATLLQQLHVADPTNNTMPWMHVSQLTASIFSGMSSRQDFARLLD